MQVTGGLMELLGPAFWAALVVLLLQAELTPVANGWAL